MRFSQLDAITELIPGSRITAVKRLRAEEEYLKDHFPRFPVMPGVLMVEAMFQASAWLVRQTEGFAHSMVLLKEARNVKFSDFVSPGEELVVTAEFGKQEGSLYTMKAQGSVGGNTAVTGRLTLDCFNLEERFPARKDTDPFLRNEMRQKLLGLLSAAVALR